MNDNIFKYNDRKKAEHDNRFSVFCEVYDPTLKHTQGEWLDILKDKGVVITRMTLHRYTKKYFGNVTHEESVSHKKRVKPHKGKSVSHERKDVTHEAISVSHETESIYLEEIVNSTKENPVIREILLQERTTGTIFDINPDVIVPRYMKSAALRKERTKKKAEVFTPIKIVKQMIDGVVFPEDCFEYISKVCIEGCCGEAPFLTTRYDPNTGQAIPISERVGVLDRKLQHIHTDDEKEWYRLAELALKSVYGFEWQEDSLFLARMNVLLSVVEFFYNQFGKRPKDVKKWAEIVSYNLIRMDGLTMCLPETKTPSLIMNWESGKMERFDGEEISEPTIKRNTRKKKKEKD